ncbi:MAG TPA: hypothetical protein DET40_04690 [Lentisphaeria bacterium]|nr:MAG: hypothetical protein A2X45_21435 [Lentisphaerae bacterium GWF2_50_93]HCE42822.1 hypothetical protein [Lentisphaeria bacterium]
MKRNSASLLLIIAASCTLLISLVAFAASDEEHRMQVQYAKGYERGFAAALGRITGSGGDLQRALSDRMSKQLIWVAFAVIVATLWGPAAYEYLRARLKKVDMPLLRTIANFEIELLYSGYVATVFLMLFFSCRYFSWFSNIPVIMLAAASIIPFQFEFISGFSRDDIVKRKIGMGKVKTMLFFMLVIIAMYYLVDRGLKSLVEGITA